MIGNNPLEHLKSLVFLFDVNSKGNIHQMKITQCLVAEYFLLLLNIFRNILKKSVLIFRDRGIKLYF